MVLSSFVYARADTNNDTVDLKSHRRTSIDPFTRKETGRQDNSCPVSFLSASDHRQDSDDIPILDDILLRLHFTIYRDHRHKFRLDPHRKNSLTHTGSRLNNILILSINQVLERCTKPKVGTHLRQRPSLNQVFQWFQESVSHLNSSLSAHSTYPASD
jgi:hypothetical protein